MTCERVIIIDYGRIIAEDTAEGLTRRLQGSHETRARVAGPREAVLRALQSLPDLEDVREEPATDGVVTVVVRSAPRRRGPPRARRARRAQRLGSARGPTLADEPRGSLRPPGAQRAGRRRVKTLALIRKELASYFAGPLVYVVVGAFLLATGYRFYTTLNSYVTFGFGMNILENFWQDFFVNHIGFYL